MRITIKELWESYQDKVIPKDAHMTQLIESRRAFYAGAQSLFTSIMTMLDPDSEPTKEDLKNMEAIEKELKDFVADVKKGKA